MQNLDKIILAEEAQHRKEAGVDGILPAHRKTFVLQWRKKHDSKIMERLGTPEDESLLKFLNGILFAPICLQKKLFLISRKFSWRMRAI